MGVEEAFLIRSAVLATARLGGDIAEVGVFRGGTARVICKAKGDRELHLCDTLKVCPSLTQAIEFFYPRMVAGGIMISHDYVAFPGVRQAFDEFFTDKPEPVIERIGNQCLVTKRGLSAAV
jgi:Macrocin-O-methyltransferase (TylF)